MGLRKFLIGKVHRATVTEADVDYMGSITMDPILIEAAGFRPLEEVDVWDVTNGARFSTYCLPGKRGGGDIRINGAAAHLAHVGDKVIVAAYGWFDEGQFGPHIAPVVIPDDRNGVARVMRYETNQATGAFEVVEE